MLNQHQTIKDNIAKYNKANPLADFLLPFIGDKIKVSILDVGSGAYSVIGSYLDDVDVDLILLDNQDFTEFWKKHNVKPYLSVEKGDMEDLSYQQNTFDIVVCLNALDHTEDALAAVKEMIRVCKPGGYIYIDCNLDQMDTGHRHQWNAKEGGEFNNRVERFELKDYGFKIEYIDNGGAARYDHIIAIKQK